MCNPYSDNYSHIKFKSRRFKKTVLNALLIKITMSVVEFWLQTGGHWNILRQISNIKAQYYIWIDCKMYIRRNGTISCSVQLNFISRYNIYLPVGILHSANRYFVFTYFENTERRLTDYTGCSFGIYTIYTYLYFHVTIDIMRVRYADEILLVVRYAPFTIWLYVFYATYLQCTICYNVVFV